MLPLQMGLPGGIELLVVTLLVFVLSFVGAYWVYTDAEKRGDEYAAFWALAVGVLTLFTGLGGLLALAVYVWQRD
ncbi:hypothetical protein SAMN04488065_0866 [Haloplanus vescus]|uniref:Uncharacterized protein n=1 Tax=Haloplanus vescus TaxID=555874 RepID=A0A1H3WI84_9EURY|nr:hypothetical protein [Haloplanus vescus]SDZ86501.1 hypothetical protein SAMN04488065_0866 [Haloplanus vescus]